MLTLHQVEWCPFCHRVRQVMTELGLSYTTVNVPARREERAELIALTDHAAVPVLEDGDHVVAGSDEIIEYLRATFPAPEDARRSRRLRPLPQRGDVVAHPARSRGATQGAARGRTTSRCSPRSTARASAPASPPTTPSSSSACPPPPPRRSQIDPAMPSAVALPVAVYAVEGGSTLAAPDPVGEVWLFGEAGLNKLQRTVRSRVDAVFAQF